MEWHTLTEDQVADKLQSNSKRGLEGKEVSDRQAKYGPNALAQKPGRSAITILVRQFMSIMVALLVVATIVAFAMGETLEGIAVLVVILLNALIGFATEWKAERTLNALQHQVVPVAHVVRDGAEHQVPATELVPGDLVILLAGARVPADGRLVECARLQIEEAALTGESHAVMKSIDTLSDDHAPIGDRTNMVFMGTTILDGRGRMIVTATGATTEMGKIGTLIGEVAHRETPLERKLERLGWFLIAIVILLCAVITTAGWLRGNSLLVMVEIAISLAIAAVPEGLPAVATMTLAIGMQRMAKLGALIRKLSAVETLGSTTVICTDKTGTLTKNEMTLSTYLLAGRQIDITGTGYANEGKFKHQEQHLEVESDSDLRIALRAGILCSDAKIERQGNHVNILGDPTEAALIVAGEKAGFSVEVLQAEEPRVFEIPFDSTTKRMVTVHKKENNQHVAYIKGSPAVIVAASKAELRDGESHSIADQEREQWLKQNQQLASQGMRVLALAFKQVAESSDAEELQDGFVLIGLVGMVDPLREEVQEAIAVCHAAGIRTVMITGDQQLTAASIAKQLGIDRNTHGESLKTVHARDLIKLNDDAWKDTVRKAAVYARVSPEHKLQIVKSLQSIGQIVAMTGDGVNDAPALKQSDIGVAMGIKGTEVAKETADMVITDDNFATIVTAVEQGRIIYSNILRFIHYLLSCNFAEILTVFIAIMIGWPLPLGPLQILWLNLITDILPALALALEPSAPDMMKRPPRNPKEPLLSWGLVAIVAWQGLLLAGVTLFAFRMSLEGNGEDAAALRKADTVAFMTLALAQVFHAFNARSQRRSAFNRRLFTNGWLWGAVGICLLLQLAAVYFPLLRRVLETSPLSMYDWGLVMVCALMPILVIEIAKLINRVWQNARARNQK